MCTAFGWEKTLQQSQYKVQLPYKEMTENLTSLQSHPTIS